MRTNAVHTYLGTFDDVVSRFPWKFKVDSKYLHHTLAASWITGRRLILNDGYLLNHPLLRDAIRNENHLLRQMLRRGAVSVAARGYRFAGKGKPPERMFGLHEMPERMAHIDTFRRMTEEGVDDQDWRAFRVSLEILDEELARDNLYYSWSPYDTTSGYLAFADKLIGEDASANTVGLGRLITKHHLQQLLRQFRDAVRASPRSGPRTVWEDLAKSYSEEPDVTNVPGSTLNGLMRLANEIYHYNFAVGLGAAYDVPVAVETQPSAAFDNLLLRRGMRLEKVTDFPKPFIPQAIAAVDPARLIGVFETDSMLGEARNSYVALLDEAQNHMEIPLHLSRSLKGASDKLSRNVIRVFAKDLKREVGLGAFDFIYSHVESGIELAVGAAVGLGTGIVSNDVVTGLGTGLLTSGMLTYAAGSRLKPVALESYTLLLDNTPDLPPEVMRNSLKALEAIKRQKVPISLQLSRAATKPLVDSLRLFA